LAVLVFALEIVLAMWLWKKTPSLKFITRLRMWLILIVVLSCLIVAECFYAFAYAFGHETILQNSRALPAFSGMQANNFLLKTHFLTVKEIESKSWENIAGHGSNGALYYPRHALHFTRQASPPNIVILGIDAWREDTMQQKIVPNIYNFSLKTARFYQHYSGGNCTLAGLYTLFYSIPSTYWKATTVPPALFDVLQQYHYRQGVFFSAGMAYPPFYRNIFLTVKGMQINIPGAEPYIRDNTITNDGLAFLDKYKTNKKPFFMFMFYDAAHSYSLSPNFKKPFQPIGAVDHADENNNTNPTPIFNVYKNALYYDDHLIGKVLAKIKAMHLYRNTIVIVTSDHGEEFNDNHHDYWGHTSNFTQYQTHIPLMIYVPGQKPQQIHYKTNHYDVMPTLLKDVFKVQNPVSDYSIGTNLFSGKPWKILPVGSYSYEGLIAPPYIYRFYPLGVTSVYDMHANIQKSFPTDALALKQYMQDISLFSRKA
jgi:membrane-anchored protein YejM (alkaline phosphatase superfamily)